MEKVMMACGHSANAKTSKGPCCIICFGKPEAEIMVTPPDLSGRMATCAYCKNTRESSTSLAFFEHRPTRKTDTYYCGCYGWD